MKNAQPMTSAEAGAWRRIGPWPYLLGLLVLLGALALALGLARSRSLQGLEKRAGHLADEMLLRGHSVSEQFDHGALPALLNAGLAQPCSAQGLALMRSLAINARALRLIGYVRNGRLECSSYGEHGESITMGPVAYVSRRGYAIRPAVRLPMAGHAPLIASTHRESGYTAFVMPGIGKELPPESRVAAYGLLAASSRRVMVAEGDVRFAPAWLDQAFDADGRAVLREPGRVVVMRRSPQFDYVAFAAYPHAEAAADFRATALLLLPPALVSGAAVALLILLQARRRQSLPERLRRALRRDELFLHYQPIVELQSGRWVGAEALARWRLADGTLISPDQFVAAAERSGQIGMLTRRMIERCVRDCGDLLRSHPDFVVSLNFSSQDFASAAAAEHLVATLAAAGLPARQFSVEITERALVDAEQVRESIRLLRRAGARVAIDDFGTGYCGLSYLATLDLDGLKIDKVFIDTIGTDAVTKSVVPHIIELARSLGLSMTAEGVETSAQARYLREQGVDHAQGWHYAKALPPAELRRRLEAQAPQAAAVPAGAVQRGLFDSRFAASTF